MALRVGVSGWFPSLLERARWQTAASLCASDLDGKNLHLVLTVPAKNLCSHTSLWSSVRQPERDANLGVESEIVQLGHSCASKQSRHMDRSGADGFWISLPRSREELMHCASLGHVDIPHTSLLFQILWSLYYTWTCSQTILILQ